MSESNLQHRTVKKLESYGFIVIRLNAGRAYSISGNPIQLSPPGSPDIMVILPDGKVKFVEFKASTGIRSTQERMHQKLSQLGHEVIIARTDEDVEEAFEGVLKPGRIKVEVPERHKRMKGYESFETWEQTL
jgi:hypothetical protein